MFRQTTKKWFKVISVKMIFLHLFQLGFPFISMGLTSGPYQPEYTGGGQNGSSELVNLFTGDFSYDIPLLEVEGYPINLHYDPNIQMNEEASWVGLGWNLNVGAVNRNLRGIPDDFNGDEIKSETSIAPNTVNGTNKGYGLDFLMLHASWGTGEYNSSYRGPGTEAFMNVSLGLGVPMLPSLIPFVKWQNRSFGLSTSANSQSGITISPSYGYGYSQLYGTLGTGFTKNRNNTETSYYNTRQGLTHTQLSHSKSWNVGVDIAAILRLAGVPMPDELSIGAGFGSGTNGSSTAPVGTNTYATYPSSSLLGLGSSTSAARGMTVLGMTSAYRSDGSHTANQIRYNTSENLKGYGYFFMEGASNDGESVLDFNREFNTHYVKETMPNISPSQNTMDVYTASAHGVAANFRPKRHDVGMNHDPFKVTNNTRSDFMKKKLWDYYMTLMLFYFPTEKVKSNSFTVGTGYSGTWKEDYGNEVEHSKYGHISATQLGKLDKVVFKNVGEKVESDLDVFESYGGYEPSSFKIDKITGPVTVDNVRKYHTMLGDIISSSGTTYTASDDEWDVPQPRQELFSYHNGTVASLAGLTKNIPDYAYYASGNTDMPSLEASLNRVVDHRKEHHMSEIEVDKPDGSRYVYGIPAYNLLQKSVSFNVSGNTKDNLTRFVEYEAGVDNSKNNAKGRNNFYSSEEIPAYAHAFLLSAVLSNDYIDRSGDGPSLDDHGSYTKFNYSMDEDVYKWRVPYSEGLPTDPGFPIASYTDNFNTDNEDDLANYIYGEREQWYLHSVETKNYIAEFYLSDRDDALGVIDEDGGKNTDVRLKRLDRIELYSREDRELNQSDAVPIKTIEFEYDYSLCKGVPNQLNPAEGKLTLKKVMISTGKSKRGKLSPYEFDYNDGVGGTNFDYDHSYLDRWGNYKPFNGTNHNTKFPYSEQDDAMADHYARAWKLHQIKTPSGAQINVTYESDDYAVVQDKRAMNMLPIAGFGSSTGATFSSSNKLFESTGEDVTAYNSFDRLYVKIDNSITTAGAFYQQYLDGIKDYYFKCEVDLNNDGGYETVNGYLQRGEYGIVTDGGNTYGYINIKPVPINDVEPDISDEIVNDLSFMNWLQPIVQPIVGAFDVLVGEEISNAEKINPIARAGWQFTRLNLPELIYPFDVTVCQSTLNPLACIGQMAGSMGYDVESLSKGEHGMLKNRDFSSSVDLTKSWIRLNDTDHKKKGGGARVSKIEITDDWANMSTSGQSSNYGAVYTYEQGNGHSSGVASFEPVIGNDENVLRQPIHYSESNVLSPDNHHYQETPVGESFYPSPVVGYSKVEVKPLEHTDVVKHGIGREVYEFYTAEDFPVIVTMTDKNEDEHVKEHVEEFVVDNFSPNLLAVSQGFNIEVNDMHGKPKARRSYSTNYPGKIVSEVEFEYRETTHTQTGQPTLSNFASVLRKDMTTDQTTIGVETDVFIDTKQSYDANVNVTRTTVRRLGFMNSFNTDFGTSVEYKSFKSVALTKLITKYGLLKTVRSTVDDRTTTKTDVLWDAETGQVLMSSVKNDYNDPIDILMQPAYWTHEGMGPAYLNRNGVALDVDIVANGVANVGGAFSFFFPGDEVLVYGMGAPRYWVSEVSNLSGGTITLIDQYGNPAPAQTGANIHVTRSGKKNMQSAPLQQLAYNDGSVSAPSGVLSAVAYDYSDDWPFYCEDVERCDAITTDCDDAGQNCVTHTTGANGAQCIYNSTNILNPFLTGTQGQWRLSQSMYFDGVRDNTNIGALENVRTDGTFASYSAYWSNSGPNWSVASNIDDWRTSNEAVKYDPNGNLLEAIDANGNFNSRVLGYNDASRKWVVAAANNARYRQIGFDGFEDYSYQPSVTECGYQDHFSFREGVAMSTDIQISDEEFHTGKRSVKLTPNSILTMSRSIDACPDEESPLPPCTNLTEEQITAASEDCIGTFHPMCGKYRIGGWVKVNTTNPVSTYETLAQIQVKILDNASAVIINSPTPFSPSGPIINGWQRIDGEFEFSELNLDCMHISLENLSGSDIVYFDDVRIHPVNSSMVSYVYDTDRSRVMAVLDNDNFATFTEYSQQDQALRTKVETTQGIVTRSESYSSLKKQ